MAELEITIKRKKPENRIVPYRQAPRGVIEPRRRQEFFPRRKQAKNAIRFFDLSQILVDGLPTDLNFSVPVTVTTLPFGQYSVTIPTIADHRTLENLTYADSPETLIERFWEIDLEAGQYFDIKLIFDDHTISLRTDERWTGSIKLSTDELHADYFAISGTDTRSFYPIFLGAGNRDHITDVYDPDAPAADFSPSNNDIYFLMPMLVRHHAYSSFSEPERIATDYFFADYAFMKRRAVLDAENDFFYLTDFLVEWNDGDDLSYYPKTYKPILYMKNYGVSAQVKRLSSTILVSNSWEDVSPDDFPNPLYFPTDAPVTGANYIKSVLTPTAELSKMLKGIIKQGNSFFYIWKG